MSNEQCVCKQQLGIGNAKLFIMIVFDEHWAHSHSCPAVATFPIWNVSVDLLQRMFLFCVSSNQFVHFIKWIAIYSYWHFRKSFNNFIEYFFMIVYRTRNLVHWHLIWNVDQIVWQRNSIKCMVERMTTVWIFE